MESRVNFLMGPRLYRHAAHQPINEHWVTLDTLRVIYRKTLTELSVRLHESTLMVYLKEFGIVAADPDTEDRYGPSESGQSFVRFTSDGTPVFNRDLSHVVVYMAVGSISSYRGLIVWQADGLADLQSRYPGRTSRRPYMAALSDFVTDRLDR
jgi:hypothetical protein